MLFFLVVFCFLLLFLVILGVGDVGETGTFFFGTFFLCESFQAREIPKVRPVIFFPPRGRETINPYHLFGPLFP